MLAALAKGHASLMEPHWRRVPTGSVEPQGWLRMQMNLQSKALTSHLPKFWPNVANSTWIGGFADVDGGLHENLPYWMNGAVPLAVQLGDQDLISTIEHYLDIIFRLQPSSGWLGPDTDPQLKRRSDADRSDFWSRMPFLMALAQYHESLPESQRHRKELCESVAYRFFMEVEKRLVGAKVATSWTYFRAHDLIWSIHYFVDRLPMESPKAQRMLFVPGIHKFNSSSFPQSAVVTDTLKTHGVNNAQAVKHGVVWGRQSGDLSKGGSFEESWLAWSQLQLFHGQPHGAFGADEHLAGWGCFAQVLLHGGRMPSRGTELCVVVESMWSLLLVAQMATRDQDALQLGRSFPFWKALDAVELLAFNALPGSLSDDLWSHPYLQMANSFQALSDEPLGTSLGWVRFEVRDHIWTHDGPQSAMYGLEPNYPCCTSNFHQGYPKLLGAQGMEEGNFAEIISAIWAPSILRSSTATIELKTGYPFTTSVAYWIQNPEPFAPRKCTQTVAVLKIRLPDFLRRDSKTLRAWQDGQQVVPKVMEGFLVFNIRAAQRPMAEAIHLDFEVTPVVTASDEGSTVRLGPLLMALDLEEHSGHDFSTALRMFLVQQHPFAAADWDTRAAQTWRVALPEEPSFGQVVQLAVPAAWTTSHPLRRRSSFAAKPLQHDRHGCPLHLQLPMLPLEPQQWPETHMAPAKPPAQVHSVGQMVNRTLLPYACDSSADSHAGFGLHWWFLTINCVCMMVYTGGC
eukprot:Skav213436  [mRNA]  locus=scaffold2160:57370:70252:+ [translate_table: standard]